jgi:hypothetical protein
MVCVFRIEFPMQKKFTMVKRMTVIAYVSVGQEWTAIPHALRKFM